MILFNLKFCWHEWLQLPIIQDVGYFGKTIPEAKEGDLRVCQKNVEKFKKVIILTMVEVIGKP